MEPADSLALPSETRASSTRFRRRRSPHLLKIAEKSARIRGKEINRFSTRSGQKILDEIYARMLMPSK